MVITGDRRESGGKKEGSPPSLECPLAAFGLVRSAKQRPSFTCSVSRLLYLGIDAEFVSNVSENMARVNLS